MHEKIALYRKAQEQALQLMCLLDAHPELSPENGYLQFYHHLYVENDELEANHITHQRALDLGEDPSNVEIQLLVKKLVFGARQSIKKIDEMIRKVSHHWRLERMTWVDRNLLRLTIHELEAYPEIPAEIAIDAAIELSKRFSTENSPAFINGILDKVKTELKR